MIPYYPSEDGTGHYDMETRAEKLVADYARISVFEVDELCYYTYRLLLRDALIHQCESTKSGREYLEKCWILEQTEPDRDKLRDKYGRKE